MVEGGCVCAHVCLKVLDSLMVLISRQTACLVLGGADVPVRKRNRRTMMGGKSQRNKENASANQPVVKRRRQTQAPAGGVTKAMTEDDM